MVCLNCGAKTEEGFTTDVTDLGNTLVIIRNFPCYKCTECNEVMYTADVVRHIEKIADDARKLMQNIAVMDYPKTIS